MSGRGDEPRTAVRDTGDHDPAARPEKRSFSIRGHRTSVSLEAPFWEALKEAAAEDERPLAALVADIDAGRGAANLSSAIRVWLLARWRSKALANLPADRGA